MSCLSLLHSSRISGHRVTTKKALASEVTESRRAVAGVEGITEAPRNLRKGKEGSIKRGQDGRVTHNSADLTDYQGELSGGS